MQQTPLSLYPWQQAAFEQWQRLLQSQRLPHAILLSGADGVGKTEFTKKILATLWCPEQGCGQCRHCQWLLQGIHPDGCWLKPEEDAKTIKIDDVREACEWLQLSPLQTRKKVLIIQPAEKLNVAASNALLKTLEEPSASSLIMLISEQPQQLLATVRSRCYKLTIALPDQTTCQNWLTQQGMTTNMLLPGLGPLALLRQLNPENIDEQQKITTIFEAILARKLLFIDAAEQLKKFEFGSVLQLLYYFVIQQIQLLTKQHQLEKLRAWLLFEEQLLEARKFNFRNANLNETLQCETLMQKLSMI